MRFVLCVFLFGCAPSSVSFRDIDSGSSSDACGQLEPPAPPPLDKCICDPDAPLCGPGLDCVPTGVDKQHACLAQCGGGSITRCESDGQPLACIYPWLDAQDGTGPGYCPACLGCSPVPLGTMACQ